MDKLKLLSLFSGIGSFEKSLTNLNINYETIGISEWDANAIISYDAIHTNDGIDYSKDMSKGDILKELDSFTFTTDGKKPCDKSKIKIDTLRKLYNANKRSKNLGSILDIDETKLPEFDLMSFGFPCQSFSVAGKQLGFADPRGTLFFESYRILAAKLPKYFIFENVQGLFTHDEGRTIEVILEYLGRLPYEITMDLINSKDMGIPQNRIRLYCLGRRIN